MFQGRSLFPKRELPALQGELSNVSAAVGKCALGFPPPPHFFFLRFLLFYPKKTLNRSFKCIKVKRSDYKGLRKSVKS